jgi:hypothetical protein
LLYDNETDTMDPQTHSFSFGKNGAHRAWTEGNDVVHIAWRGDVSAEDVIAGARAFELVPNGAKGFFLILHVADQGRFSSDAREAIRADPRSGWVREGVVVGASFHHRVLMGMISRAMLALGAGKASISFVDHEEEVPAQIERMRSKWNGKR